MGGGKRQETGAWRLQGHENVSPNNKRACFEAIIDDVLTMSFPRTEKREIGRQRETEGERESAANLIVPRDIFFSIQIIINLSLLRLDVDGGRFSASSYSSPLLFFSILCQIC